MGPEEKPGRGGERQEGFCGWLVRFLGCCPLDSGRQQRRVGNRRVHLANERTLLSWLRTAVGLMALGFVVARFHLFAQRFEGARQAVPTGISAPFGVVLIILGSAIGVLAAVRFLVVEREIETDTYRPSILLNLILVMVLVAIGIFLAVSLWDGL